jgi:lipoate synthase
MPKCRQYDVDVVTLGQYMRPTRKHMAVAEYVTPQAFDGYQKVRRYNSKRSTRAGWHCIVAPYMRGVWSRARLRLQICMCSSSRPSH